MPDDVDALITELFGRGRDERPTRRPRSLTRLDDEVFALDYGDEGHTFQLAVELVPRRRWAPKRPVRVGHVEGVQVELVGVTVDTLVHVHLIAEQTAERDRLSRDYDEAFQRWVDTPPERGDPPDDPARRLFRVTLEVGDALGTEYTFWRGQAGGTGTEWEATRSFRPRPPAAVRELRLTLQAPDQQPLSVRVPL